MTNVNYDRPPGRFRWGAWIGSKMIVDLLNPHPSEIDLEAVYENMACQHRYSNCPRALTIKQHTYVVRELYKLDMAGLELPLDPVMLDWCEHHDDHEGVLGDTIDPVKQLIRERTPILDEIEHKLDMAICLARAVPFPPEAIRRAVKPYDKLAATIEWLYVLDRPVRPWHTPIPGWLSRGTIDTIHRRAKGK